MLFERIILCVIADCEGKVGGRLKTFTCLCCLVDEENSGKEKYKRKLKRKYYTISYKEVQIFKWAESLRRVVKNF